MLLSFNICLLLGLEKVQSCELPALPAGASWPASCARRRSQCQHNQRPSSQLPCCHPLLSTSACPILTLHQHRAAQPQLAASTACTADHTCNARPPATQPATAACATRAQAARGQRGRPRVQARPPARASSSSTAEAARLARARGAPVARKGARRSLPLHAGLPPCPLSARRCALSGP